MRAKARSEISRENSIIIHAKKTRNYQKNVYILAHKKRILQIERTYTGYG